MNKRNGTVFAVMVCMMLTLPVGAVADSVTPASYETTLDVGGTVSIDKTVTISNAPPTTAKVDVFFLFDTTGSMGGLIDSAKANASEILANAAVLGDLAFAVGHYEDFPVAPYGVEGDVAYELTQNITTNTAAVEAAINGLDLGNGNDTPEAQLYALCQLASTTAWRGGSTRIVVWFGDAPGHDGDLDTDYPSNIGLTDASTCLIGQKIHVEAIDLSNMDFTGQATAIANVTGGHVWHDVSPSQIVQVIQDAIEAVFQEYHTVSLDTSAAPAGVTVAVNPPNIVGNFDRSAVREFEFAVTFTGVAAGNHDFNINALVDGGIVASEHDLIHVGGDVPICGNEIAEPGEECGEPTLPECPLDKPFCVSCTCSVVAIDLKYFLGVGSDGLVKIYWGTESEIDNAGFNIWRSTEKDGEYIKINDQLIVAQGGPSLGAKYTYIDGTVDNGLTYWYKLEDIDTAGVSTFHGPIIVATGLGIWSVASNAEASTIGKTTSVPFNYMYFTALPLLFIGILSIAWAYRRR